MVMVSVRVVWRIKSDDMMSDLMIDNDEEAGSEVSNTDDNDDKGEDDDERDEDNDDREIDDSNTDDDETDGYDDVVDGW